jgi:TrmH RNA methyltransferase
MPAHKDEPTESRGPTDRGQAVERIYGLSAALAVLEVRPEDVLRLAYSPRARAALANALRAAAKRRIAYRELSDEELKAMAGAVHHEGVCVLARPREEPTPDELAARTQPRGLIAALDGVDNPHNIGAVLRSAAFFGVAGLLVADPQRSALPSSARRIAEGGAEHVPYVHLPELAPALRALQQRGHQIIGTDSENGTPLPDFRWPPRCVLVLGAEDEGLSPAVRARCTTVIRIPGTPAVQSLNVSAAAAVLFASYQR